MKALRLIAILTLVSAATACQEEEPENCNLNGACTLELRSIGVEIVNRNGEQVFFDEFSITNLRTGEAIDSPDWNQGGWYTLADDTMQDELSIDGDQVELVGIINGFEVLRQIFIIGHNCCHVILIDGPERIQI